jgi:hypothetical protein
MKVIMIIFIILLSRNALSGRNWISAVMDWAKTVTSKLLQIASKHALTTRRKQVVRLTVGKVRFSLSRHLVAETISGLYISNVITRKQ